MPFRTIRAYADAMDATGATWTSWVWKTGGPASFGAGRWGDLSMGAGTPKYNAYVGTQAAATPLIGVGNDGIFTGPAPSAGQTKHLHQIFIQSSSTTLAPARFTLCDYLMHYPLIDGDDTAQQDLDNTQTLPRYTSGEGVQCMIVCTTPMVANASATLNYTNSDGVPGRTVTFQVLSTTVVGCIVSSADNSGAANSASPFVPLANGDKGIRSIQSITLTTGSAGFFAIVLVKPLAHVQVRESLTVTELDGVTQRGGSVPQIYDGAYLNFIYQPGQSGTAVSLRAGLTYVWG